MPAPHFAILGSSQGWYANDLQRAAGSSYRLTTIAYRDICSSVDESGIAVTSGAIDLRRLDALIVRTMPPGSLEQIIFRMDALGRLESEGVTVVNPPRAIEVAVDKYLATARLRAAGLDVPRTVVTQTAEEALAAFDALGGDVVVKPLFGSEGRGIMRLTDAELAWRTFRTLSDLGAVLYVQSFVPHEGFDFRVLILGEQTLALRRANESDWRTNLSRGAVASPVELDDALLETARCAARAVGAPIAGVDLLPGRNGRTYVLEVNAVPGWKGLAAALHVDVSRLVLDYVANAARACR